MPRARALERLLVSLHVLVPEAALLNVGGRELPTLIGALDAFQQALPLLLAREVEEELQDVDAVLNQVTLEVVNLPVAPLPEAVSRDPLRQLLPLQLLRVHPLGHDLL